MMTVLTNLIIFYDFIIRLTAKIGPQLSVLKFIKHQNLKTAFPNVSKALRIFLSLHVTVCDAECSFIKMILVKKGKACNDTMSQDKLNCLAIKSTESYRTRVIYFRDVDSKFAGIKVRKANF